MQIFFFVLAFLFFIPAGLKAQQQDKYSFALLKKMKLHPYDSIDVSVSSTNVSQLRGSKDLNILKQVSSNIVVARIRASDIRRVSSYHHVQFINEVMIAREELTTGAFDLSLNKISLAHSNMSFISGDSIFVSVKERLFDTLDIDLKGRVFYTGHEPVVQTAHASLMATIIAGGANSSPFARGVAWKSHVSSSGFHNLFADADSIFVKHGISAQNHSYGTVVENFYGNEAFSYDRQANNIPYLVHVFSAGNSGLETGSGPYTGVAQFANLTGNFKQAKNILTVGSVDSAGQIMPLSSKGPAYDGRIKPELMAYGEDGSSGAGATVTGVVVLLQEAYKNIHGVLPSGSLIKALLLNSADDIGNPYPDYNSGFGNLDAYGALQAISQSRYYEDEIIQGETKHLNIMIPPGASQLKVTIAWNDPVSIPNASKALVNNIDMEVSSVSTGEIWLPWVLDPNPSISSLTANAQRKKDTLNNIEQVTIGFPVPGQYSIKVNAPQVNNGSQKFSLTWQVDSTGSLFWTYPSVKDQLIAGNTHWLRWETKRQGAAQIEYATNGSNWKQAGMVSEADINYFKWKVPDTVTVAVLRIIHSGEVFTSDSFTISPQLQLSTGYNCADSFLLYWNKIQDYPYEVFQLEDRYLTSFHTTTDTSVILDKTQHPSIYYSVAPVINGRTGIKSNTINYPALGPSCYINAFYLQSQTSFSATFTADLGTLFGVASVTLQKITPAGIMDLKLFNDLSSTVFLITDSTLTRGENHFRLRLQLYNGTVYYSNTEVVFHWLSLPVIVYPVPVAAGRQLNIISSESGRYTINIFDSHGKLVFVQLLTSTHTQFNTAILQRGLYVIRIIDREGEGYSQKMIVQ